MKKLFISVAALAAVILGIVFVVATSNYLTKYSIRDYAADIEKDIETPSSKGKRTTRRFRMSLTIW